MSLFLVTHENKVIPFFVKEDEEEPFKSLCERVAKRFKLERVFNFRFISTPIIDTHYEELIESVEKEMDINDSYIFTVYFNPYCQSLRRKKLVTFFEVKFV